ncbi:MAG: protein kinase [Spirochaetales bacterium]|jgi:serine/threonine protein kinase|nr:protein kinase [Spirochaetales bacterium]
MANDTVKMGGGDSAPGMDSDDSTLRMNPDNSTLKMNPMAPDNSTLKMNPMAPDNSTLKMNPMGSDDSTLKMGTVPAAPQSQAVLQNTSASAKNIGQVITLNGKDWKITDVISRGTGEADVYKVSGPGGEVRALKLYHPGKRFPQGVLDIIKQKPQSHVIKVYDSGQADGQDCEIMEYAEGGSLESYLREAGGIRDKAILKNYLLQFNEGLRELHEEIRIIYQDFKPSNIYFTDKERKNIVLADFGISAMQDPQGDDGLTLVNTSQSLTYSAPDLWPQPTADGSLIARALVGVKVDYFSLGITLFEMWLGKTPFYDIDAVTRQAQIRSESFPLPDAMDAEFQALIRRLAETNPKVRWGYTEIKEWLEGTRKAAEQTAAAVREAHAFSATESFVTPAELAVLLKKNPDSGIEYLYKGTVERWLTEWKVDFLANAVNNIVHSDSRKDAATKQFNLHRTIYTLNDELPFISKGGKICTNAHELAQALLDEQDFYLTDLQSPYSLAYAYLNCINQDVEKNLGSSFRNSALSPKYALHTFYLDCTGMNLPIGSRVYKDFSELKAESNKQQQKYISDELAAPDSLLMCFLHKKGVVSKSTFFTLDAVELFTLMSELPYVRGDYAARLLKNPAGCLDHLAALIKESRWDLIDIYAGMKLPFTGRCSKSTGKDDPTPFYFASLFSDSEFCEKACACLKDRGADPNETSGNGYTALYNAALADKPDSEKLKMLLRLGCDPNRTDAAGGVTCLELVLSTGSLTSGEKIDAARILLEAGADPSKCRTNPLLLVINKISGQGAADLAQKLADKGADLTYKDQNGTTLLMEAAVKNHREMVEFLLKKGLDRYALDKYNRPAFKMADDPAVKALLKSGGAVALKYHGFIIVRCILKIIAITGVFFCLDTISAALASLELAPPAQRTAAHVISLLLAANLYFAVLGSLTKVKYRKTGFIVYLVVFPFLLPPFLALLSFFSGLLPPGIWESINGTGTAWWNFAYSVSPPDAGSRILAVSIATFGPLAALLIWNRYWEKKNISQVYKSCK